MVEVLIDNKKRFLPSRWNELTRDQLIYVCSIFGKYGTLASFQVNILRKFLSLGLKQFKKIAPDDVIFLSESFSFLQNDVTLTRCLVKSIRVPRFPWNRYTGPTDNMSECTFGEFIKAQVRYEQYASAPDARALDELAAILYRPRKWFWWIRKHFTESNDPRQRFMDKNLPARAGRMSRVDHATKYSVFLFLSGIQASLMEKFPNVYRQSGGSDKRELSGWASLVISLADGKTDDASLNCIMNSNLYNVFFGLEKKSIDYYELKRKFPEND